MNQLATTEEKNTLPDAPSQKSVMALIVKMASDPTVDVLKLEKLLEMQERIVDRQAKIDYANALRSVQNRVPRIAANGEIKNREGKTTSRYMKYEDIDKAVRDILFEEGFSIRNDRRNVGDKMIVITTLTHVSGHSETVEMPLPYDQPNALKSAIQAAVSTYSYGKRINLCSLLNIVEEGQDDEGQAAANNKINAGQVSEIKMLMQNANADKDRFLSYMGVDAVEDVRAKDFYKATSALAKKMTQGN